MFRKVLFCSFLMVLSLGMVHANPTPFGVEIGKFPCKDLDKKFKITENFKNVYGEYSYKLSPGQITLDNVSGSLFTCNAKGDVVALWVKFNSKSGFNQLAKSLSEKYKVIFEEIPDVGNKHIALKDGDVRVDLSAEHLDFDMYLVYRTNESYNNQLEIDRRSQVEKEQRDKNNL